MTSLEGGLLERSAGVTAACSGHGQRGLLRPWGPSEMLRHALAHKAAAVAIANAAAARSGDPRPRLRWLLSSRTQTVTASTPNRGCSPTSASAWSLMGMATPMPGIRPRAVAASVRANDHAARPTARSPTCDPSTPTRRRGDVLGRTRAKTLRPGLIKSHLAGGAGSTNDWTSWALHEPPPG